MAPEACREEVCSYCCDIWSLGCTVLQMATNQLPWSEQEFEGSIPAFFHIATCTAPPVIPDTVPTLAAQFIAACVQLETEHRPGSSALLGHAWLAEDEVWPPLLSPWLSFSVTPER